MKDFPWKTNPTISSHYHPHCISIIFAYLKIMFPWNPLLPIRMLNFWYVAAIICNSRPLHPLYSHYIPNLYPHETSGNRGATGCCFCPWLSSSCVAFWRGCDVVSAQPPLLVDAWRTMRCRGWGRGEWAKQKVNEATDMQILSTILIYYLVAHPT